MTPPDRNDGTGLHTTYFYYDANGSGDDYTRTDSNVTWVALPSGKKTKTFYDDNRRKSYVTVAYGTSDAATTSYGYDGVGNVTSVTNPLNHDNVSTLYDERNRPYSITVGGRTTTLTYDTAGRKGSVTRPNGQVITYESYDNMNRLLQQRMTQSPEPDAVSRYAYYAAGNPDGQPVGLLNTFEDPRTYNSGNTYKYEWDSMGRKKKLTYPPDSDNVQRTEQWSYDTSGRLQTFTNRNGKIQTFGYDGLNRMTGFTWNNGGLTPSVSFSYDAASRLSPRATRTQISRGLITMITCCNTRANRSFCLAASPRQSPTPTTPTATGPLHNIRTSSFSLIPTRTATSSRA